MKQFVAIFVVGFLLLGFLPFVASGSNVLQFTDLDSNSKIYTLVEAGIINGFGDSTFRPQDPLTRAQVCKIINLIFGYTESSETSFKDVSPSDWYRSHALIAQAAGYIQGYPDGTFRQGNYITRQEVCTIMVRILELRDSELAEFLKVDVKINDAVSDWAKSDVMLFLKLPYLKLDSAGNFRATQPMTRQDFCELMVQFYEKAPDETVPSPAPSVGTPPSTPPDESSSPSPPPPEVTPSPTPPDETPPADESMDDEAIASIRTVYTALAPLKLGKAYPAASQQIVNLISSTFKAVLADADAGTTITPEYIKQAYSAEIENVRTLWNGLSENNQAKLKTKFASVLDLADIDTLQTYFLGGS